MDNFGFARVAAAVPIIRVAEPHANAEESLKILIEAVSKKVQLVVFPELNLSGYTCGDLFNQITLQKAALNALEWFVQQTSAVDCMAVVGLPLQVDNQLFNVAAVCYKGMVRAFIPKSFLPNYKEFYETRWFAPASRLRSKEIMFNGGIVPIGTDIIIKTNIQGFSLGVEICEDLWMPIPPSSHAALQGATVIVNLSASNGLIGKADYRRDLVKQQSARCISAYVFASCGYGESTSDVVFDGHAMIAENGKILKESERFLAKSQLIVFDVDVECLQRERSMFGSFGQAVAGEREEFRRVEVDTLDALELCWIDSPERFVDPHPFIPSDQAKLDERCWEVFQLQTLGLMRRLEHVDCREVTIGVSGGLDSTLALINTCYAFDKLKWDRTGIKAVTMPGFGTTDRTKNNAIALAELLGLTIQKVPIKRATLMHLDDIKHDCTCEEHDISCLVCQNAQARERTKILMDIGFTIGTGDLSESALGWCTYNGDHMSMYHVNCGVPKTLVKYVITWVAKNNLLGHDVSDILLDIVDTPISPELDKPNKDGEIEQRTEDIIGPYELHDFFMFHTIRNGFGPKKIYHLSRYANFDGQYDVWTIKKWLKEYYKRFFFAQFKRNAAPDGPKIGSVALSQRGDWRMPSDIKTDLWLSQVDNMP